MSTQTQSTKTAQEIETQISEAVSDASALDAIRDSISEHVQSAASAVVSLSEAVSEIAAQVVAARQLFSYDVKNKSGKVTRTVPDWNGRSQAYKLWYNRTVPALVSEHIGDEYGAKILSRLRYHVQLLAFENAPTNLRRPLSLTDPRKTRRSKSNRGPSDSVEVQAVSAFVAGTETAPKSLVDLCQDLAAVATGLHTRIGAEDRPNSKRVRDRMLKLMAQANEHIVAAAQILQTEPSEIEVTTES